MCCFHLCHATLAGKIIDVEMVTYFLKMPSWSTFVSGTVRADVCPKVYEKSPDKLQSKGETLVFRKRHLPRRLPG